MSRIPLITGDDLSPAQQAVYDRVVSGPRGVVVGPLRAALHSPELAERWQSFGAFLRYDTELSRRSRELAIICCGRFWNSPLEWQIHADVAADAGIGEDVIEAIRTACAPAFETVEDLAVYEFTRELLHNGQVSEATYQLCLETLDKVRLVELTAVVGYYTLVAMTVNVHNIPPPELVGEPKRMALNHGGQAPIAPTHLARSVDAPIVRRA